MPITRVRAHSHEPRESVLHVGSRHDASWQHRISGSVSLCRRSFLWNFSVVLALQSSTILPIAWGFSECPDTADNPPETDSKAGCRGLSTAQSPFSPQHTREPRFCCSSLFLCQRGCVLEALSDTTCTRLSSDEVGLRTVLDTSVELLLESSGTCSSQVDFETGSRV